MQYRKFGKTGRYVSALGFGAMRLPSKGFMPMQADVEESIRIIRLGIDLGINYIDTAWPYHFGASEKILGRALAGGYREKVILATKLPMFMVRKAEDFDKYLHEQMERLKTSHIDVYLFHSMTKGQFEKMKDLKLLDRMLKAKSKGLVKYIGFSFHDTLPVFKEIIDYYAWDVAQIQYNYMDTGFQAGAEGMKYAYEKGIAVVVMEPLKGGRLANPPAEAVEIMKGAKTQRTPVDWALQYLWNMPEVSVVLSGMSSRKMVEENCASAGHSGVNSLCDEDKKIIARLAEVYRKKILVPCTACGYCMPCPVGVNIPQVFAVLNNVSIEDRGIYRWFERRRYLKLAGAGKKLNKENPNGNASVCIECGKCLGKCPQRIKVPEELKKAHEVLAGRRKKSI